MSEIQAGADYVEAITALQSDRSARSAYQDLVLRIATPGAALFDFGAGPGIDARFYAEREKHPRAHEWLWRLDRRVAAWPLVRGMGDHFLIVMKKR
jgi:hypothetical protein